MKVGIGHSLYRGRIRREHITWSNGTLGQIIADPPELASLSTRLTAKSGSRQHLIDLSAALTAHFFEQPREAPETGQSTVDPIHLAYENLVAPQDFWTGSHYFTSGGAAAVFDPPKAMRCDAQYRGKGWVDNYDVPYTSVKSNLGPGARNGSAAVVTGYVQPTIIDSDYVGSGSAITNYDVPVPTGLQENDLILVAMVTNTTVADTVTLPDANWFTIVPSSVLASANGYGSWWHQVTAAEVSSPPSAWTFTLGTARTGNFIVARIRGHNTTNPFEKNDGSGPTNDATLAVQSATSGTTSTTVASISSSKSNVMLFGAGFLQSATSQSISSPPTFTDLQNTCGLSLGRGQVVGYEMAGAGASGTRTWTKTSALQGASYMLFISPTTTPSVTPTGPHFTGGSALYSPIINLAGTGVGMRGMFLSHPDIPTPWYLSVFFRTVRTTFDFFGAYQEYVISLGADAGGNLYDLLLGNSTQTNVGTSARVRFLKDFLGTPLLSSYDTTVVNDGEWHHGFIWAPDANTIRAYVDGQQFASHSGAGIAGALKTNSIRVSTYFFNGFEGDVGFLAAGDATNVTEQRIRYLAACRGFKDRPVTYGSSANYAYAPHSFEYYYDDTAAEWIDAESKIKVWDGSKWAPNPKGYSGTEWKRFF